MKSLVKLLVIVLFINLVPESFAQSFGVKAGFNLSNMLMKDNEEDYSNDFSMKPGFHIGGTFELPISKVFAFETGLLFTTKGFKYNDKESFEGDTYEFNASYNLFYFDIPIMAKAYLDAGGAKLYGAFGPYLGVGVAGNIYTEYIMNDDSDVETEDIEWGNDEDNELKRLDYGLGFGAGVEYKSMVFGVSYNLGLANVSSYLDDGATMKNKVLGFSLAYKFGGKKTDKE
ncbi:MAG: outer membrane beta-barrel protein [Bacteroidales bacterium]|nr:outer membrane beta-barrel protein [Bacteroidales bacterium]